MRLFPSPKRNAFCIPYLLDAACRNAPKMADVEMTEDDSTSQPVPSIESKDETKADADPEQEGEAGADVENSDNDAPVDNDDEGIEVMDLTDGKTAGDLYKSFKAITEILLNFKIKVRGNE